MEILHFKVCIEFDFSLLDIKINTFTNAVVRVSRMEKCYEYLMKLNNLFLYPRNVKFRSLRRALLFP